MKKKLIKKIVNLGVFDFTVVLLIGDMYQADKFAQEFFEEIGESKIESFKKSKALCLYKEQFKPIIWMPKKPEKKEDIITLAHECLHAVFHLYDWLGIEIKKDNNEIATHALCFLMEEFTKNDRK